MMEQEILGRIQNLETIIRGFTLPPDHSAELKSLRADLTALGQGHADLTNRIPDIKHLATKQELMANIHAVAESLVDGVVSGEKAGKAEIMARIDSTLGMVHAEVQASKNAALAFGIHAAEALRTKSLEFAR
ncbi:MAG: hypothetical protein RLZZ627_762 [Pseudomonadota bacterium]|jgi:hypothetical protein